MSKEKCLVTGMRKDCKKDLIKKFDFQFILVVQKEIDTRINILMENFDIYCRYFNYLQEIKNCSHSTYKFSKCLINNLKNKNF